MNTLVYTVHIMNNQQKQDTATLAILQTIENQNDVTQRHLADKLGVALGLANSYLKRCVRKGLVKVQQAPANRYFYYLTPKGFSEKGRLTTEYLSDSFNFYRKASESLAEIYSDCQSKGKQKFIFCGISELAEIASVRAHEYEIKVMGILDTDSKKKMFLNLPVSKRLSEINEFDVCLLTSLDKSDQYYDFLINSIDNSKTVVPSILGIKHVTT